MSDLTGLASIVPATPIGNVPLWRQTILLHGAPKIGKTTFAADFPNALFLDAEQGTGGIEVPSWENLLGRDRFADPVTTWKDVLDGTSQLEMAKGRGIEGVLVIDTAQASFDMAREYVRDRMGFEHESDVGYGKAWRAVKDEYSTWINRLKGTGFGLIFISHTKTVEIEEPSRKYERKVARLDTGPRDVIEPFVNIILHADVINVKGKECRVVHTKPSTEIQAGERGKSPRLQGMLPFEFDAVNRNWNGEHIDLNEWFGFVEPRTPEQKSLDAVQAAKAEFDATPSN